MTHRRSPPPRSRKPRTPNNSLGEAREGSSRWSGGVREKICRPARDRRIRSTRSTARLKASPTRCHREAQLSPDRRGGAGTRARANEAGVCEITHSSRLCWRLGHTVHIAEIVKRLEASSGETVSRDELARISPLLHAHVIPSGTYRFERASLAREAKSRSMSRYRNFRTDAARPRSMRTSVALTLPLFPPPSTTAVVLRRESASPCPCTDFPGLKPYETGRTRL